MSVPDIDTLTPEIRERLAALRPSEDSFLPAVIVDMQRALAVFTDNELMHLIVGGSVQLAARNVGTLGPAHYLSAALESAEKSMTGERWLELGPEVRRLCHEAWVEHGNAPVIPEVPSPLPDPEPPIEPVDAPAP